MDGCKEDRQKDRCVEERMFLYMDVSMESRTNKQNKILLLS